MDTNEFGLRSRHPRNPTKWLSMFYASAISATIMLTAFGVASTYASTYTYDSDSGSLNVSDNARWAIDLSSRINKEIQGGQSSQQYTVGLDFHSKLIYQNRDIATITLQPYWVQLNNAAAFPEFFDDGDDSAINWRINNINFTGLNKGKFNIRVGHFEIPFGIEQNLDSNGTLRQFTFSDRGIKTDWGLSANGVLPRLEYEIALTRGSGNNWTNNSDPYLGSGRIGSLSTSNLIWGISYLYGDILTNQGISERRRAGVDLTYYHYQWEFYSELSTGKNDQSDTNNAWFEIAWNNRSETLKPYGQWQYRTLGNNGDKEKTQYLVLGIQWFTTNKIDISAQWQETLAPQNNNDQSTANIQFRWRI